MITYRIEGGLGKHIVFTCFLKGIFEKHGKFNVISSYKEVFENNPYVENSWLDIEKDKSKISEIIFTEPYKTEFEFNEKHIIESWAQLLDIDKSLITDPMVVLTEEEIQKAKEFQPDGEFFIVQFSGGQSPAGWKETQEYKQTKMVNERNYPFQMAQILVNKLRKKYPKATIINCSLPNEYNLKGTIHIPVNFKSYFEFTKHAKGIICIDSMLQHISASNDTPTIVLWNRLSWTPSHKYGWKKHVNLEEDFIAIDYDDVLYEMNRLVKKK